MKNIDTSNIMNFIMNEQQDFTRWEIHPLVVIRLLLSMIKTEEDFIFVKEWRDGEAFFCEIQRQGNPLVRSEFTIENARQQNQIHTNRIFKADKFQLIAKHRALSLALQKSYSDVLMNVMFGRDNKFTLFDDILELNTVTIFYALDAKEKKGLSGFLSDITRDCDIENDL